MAHHIVLKAFEQEKDEFGVTIAVAVLLQLDGRTPQAEKVEHWMERLDEALVQCFDGDENTPIGVAIRATERTGKRIAADLVLDAAVGCVAPFETSRDERRPRRTIGDFGKPGGGITCMGWTPTLARYLSGHGRAV